jgi:hypothetical protein
VPAGGPPLAVPAFAPATFALTLGTAVYAFEGVGMVVPVYEALSPRAQARFPYTMSATVAFIAALYITVGLVPYLYVEGVRHEDVADAITLNLPRVWWSCGCFESRSGARVCRTPPPPLVRPHHRIG